MSRAPRARAIVVGTDGSPGARRAVDQARAIALRCDATVHVVHVSARLPRALAKIFGVTDGSGPVRLLDEATAPLEAAGVRAAAHHVESGVANGIARVAVDVRAALVVVGTRGRAVPDAVVGSTAERVTSIVRVPVLLVRRSGGRPYHAVTVAADLDSTVREQLAAARLVAPDADRAVLHVFEAPYEHALFLHGATAANVRSYRTSARDEAERAMREVLKAARASRERLVVRHGSPPRILVASPRDTLVVLDRGRSRLRHALLGSVSRAVIAHGKSDVLLV